MTAIALVEAARRAGLTLRPVGDKLGVRPASRIPAELRKELLARKDEVLAVIAGKACAFFWGHRPAGPCARCGASYAAHLQAAGIVMGRSPSKPEARP